MRTERVAYDGPKEPHIVLRGRGTFKRDKPIVAIRVGGSRPYLWIGEGECGAETYLLSLSPANSRKLAQFLMEHFDG